MTEHRQELHVFCKRYRVTVANIFQVVWRLVLRSLNNADEVNFGYATSGRDIFLDGIEDALGPYVNLLVCRINMDNNIKVLDLVEKTREDWLQTCHINIHL